MKLIDVHKQFQTEDQCLDYLEQMRWPGGEIGCVHCGEIGRVSKITREKRGKNKEGVRHSVGGGRRCDAF